MSEEKIEEKKKKLSTWGVLRNKFPANEYVLIEEVSDASGFSRSRSLDYMLINLWESRGLAISGIEKKTNRSDWLRELKNPKKQEKHFKYCDYFYLLTDREDVAKIEEIPVSWGWYHINDKQILKTIKPAPRLNPEPVNRSFLCAMLRRAACKDNFVHRDSIEDRIKEAADRQKQHHDYLTKERLKEFDKLKESIVAFEQESGIKIHDHKWIWKEDAVRVGKAIKWLRDWGFDHFEERLQKLQKESKTIHEQISETLTNILQHENNKELEH